MMPALSNTSWKKICHSRVATLAQKWQGCKAYSYYTVNRLLLLSIGLWPYQGSGSRRIVIPLMTVVLISSVAVQLTTFITTEYDVDVLLHVFAYSIPWLAYTLKYNVLCFNIKKIRDLMERVRCDWDELSNAQEIEIIKKHSAFGRFMTIASTLFIYISTCGVFSMQLVSNYLLDFVTPANESRTRRIPIMAEYFVDQQKYYALILSHIFLVALCGLTTVAATETLLLLCTQHACGLFEIASFRIERALRRSSTQDGAFPVKRNSICGIISAIDIQKKAFTFVEQVEANFKWAYLVLLPLGIMSMSINLYRLSYLLTTENYYELVISLAFVLGHVWYLMFVNYIGQNLIDQGNEMLHRMYNAQWHTASVKAQKLLWIVMQRTMRHCVIIAVGGLVVPSLEGFEKLVSMSVSYFMMLLSVQDR